VSEPHGSCRLTVKELLIAEDAEKSRRGRRENLIGPSGGELALGEAFNRKERKESREGRKEIFPFLLRGKLGVSLIELLRFQGLD
jgi:hypothetical protein